MTDAIADEEHGLICAFALDRNGGAKDLIWDEIGNDAGGELKWIHLNFTNANARQWLRTQSRVDPVIVEALLDEDSRPRLLSHENGLLVILRGVNMNPGADVEDMVSIRVWLESDRIISTRRRKLMSIQRLREALHAGQGPKSAGQFLEMLVALLDQRIAPVIDELDEEIEAAEHNFSGAVRAPYSGEFSALRRQTARIRRYLAPQREALERLSREPNAVLTADQCTRLREEADQMTRYLEDLDLVRERSMVAQEEILGQLAHEQNRRMYVLSLVAAIFLPLSFLTGLMGMNVAGLPGTEDPLAFLLLSGAMILVAVGIVALFKWQKWL